MLEVSAPFGAKLFWSQFRQSGPKSGPESIPFAVFYIHFLNDKATVLYLKGKTSRNLAPAAETNANRTALFSS